MSSITDNVTKPASYAGIPEATFLEDVNEFMKDHGTVASVLGKFEEQHQKYKFMEVNLLSKKKRLNTQIPDIKHSLEIVKQLQVLESKGAETTSHFLLADQVYAKAEIGPSKTVFVWMGAGCMLEYPLQEARQILTDRFNKTAEDLSQVDHDIDFLRDQFTIVQVNIARVYNWDVRRRQANKIIPS